MLSLLREANSYPLGSKWAELSCGLGLRQERQPRQESLHSISHVLCSPYNRKKRQIK